MKTGRQKLAVLFMLTIYAVTGNLFGSAMFCIEEDGHYFSFNPMTEISSKTNDHMEDDWIRDYKKADEHPDHLHITEDNCKEELFLVVFVYDHLVIPYKTFKFKPAVLDILKFHANAALELIIHSSIEAMVAFVEFRSDSILSRLRTAVRLC